MSLLFFLVFGFVVGLIARAITPGEQRMGVGTTTLLGIIGSFVGGFLVALVMERRVTELHTASIVGSVVGAVILLFIGTRTMGRAPTG